MRWVPRAETLLVGCAVALIGSATIEVSRVSAQDAPVARVKLGFDNQTPGKEVAIALVLDVTAGAEVGSTVGEVSFPSKLLTFKEVRPSVVAQGNGAEIRGALKTPGPDPKTSVVTVTATARTGESLSTGVLADLVFEIASDAPIDSSIDLKLAAKAFLTGKASQPVASVVTENGTIKVTDFAPVITCFFYMH